MHGAVTVWLRLEDFFHHQNDEFHTSFELNLEKMGISATNPAVQKWTEKRKAIFFILQAQI
jgi:hypothetical protein